MRLKAKRALAAFLKKGGIVAYATESCFGLGCDPNHHQALQKILQLKKRDATKGMIVIGANIQQLLPLCAALPPAQIEQLRKSWPAAHTWVVPSNPNIHAALGGGRNTIAMRVPDHAGARMLCLQANMPLVSTSANISGRKSIKTYRAALRKFSGRVKVIHGKIGHYQNPSMVQDLLTGKILRK